VIKRSNSTWNGRAASAEPCQVFRSGPPFTTTLDAKETSWTVKRMDNVRIVVEDIDAAIEFFTELWPRARGARPNRRRLGRWRHWITRHARRDCHDAYAGRSQPARDVPIPRAACRRRSPQRPGERSRLPTRHVHRGGHRRYARPARPNVARGSSAKWSSTKTRIGSATSGAPKEFSSGLPKSSGSRLPMSTCDRYRPDRDAYSRWLVCRLRASRLRNEDDTSSR